MRQCISYPVHDRDEFRIKWLFWLNRFSTTSLLGSNDFYNENSSRVLYHSFDYIAGTDPVEELIIKETPAFDSLKDFWNKHKDWLFGFLSYDMKNETEKLFSKNPDGIKMPCLHFFRPRYVFILYRERTDVHYIPELNTKKDVDKVMEEILNEQPTGKQSRQNSLNIRSRFSMEEYLKTVQDVKHHILIGDIYELNLCHEFYAEHQKIDPLDTYFNLVSVSPTPFSCYYRLKDTYLLSASPERFIKKTGNKVISQPMKGTIRRSADKTEDMELMETLYHDPKERAENIMIVDLVRNDLSKTAIKATVNVEELFGIYSFSQVHQMVSTITSQVDDTIHWVDIIRNAFPMGSMTGAPKVKAMELIEKYEKTKRGLYSGSVGYITPAGDFDFNVVIRSIQYNAAKKYVSFIVGGAITHHSIPEKEYEECLVKAEAILKVLT